MAQTPQIIQWRAKGVQIIKGCILRLGMMKKQRFLVYTEYIFDGVFDVVAESKEEARQKVLQHCGLVMGGSIHSTLPDDEINWAFDRHPNKRIDRITKV